MGKEDRKEDWGGNIFERRKQKRVKRNEEIKLNGEEKKQEREKLGKRREEPTREEQQEINRKRLEKMRRYM